MTRGTASTSTIPSTQFQLIRRWSERPCLDLGTILMVASRRQKGGHQHGKESLGTVVPVCVHGCVR